MAMKVIPTKYVHSCDMCGTSVETAGTGHPERWADVKFDKDAYDYQGCAVASAAYSLRLCSRCADSLEAFIDSYRKETAHDH